MQLVEQTELERIVALVHDGDGVEASVEVWSGLEAGEGLTFLGRAALIHAWATVYADDSPLYRQVVLDENEELASSWGEFCLRHLKMAPSTASNYKLLWGMYQHYPFRDLLAAGVSKLVAARKLYQETGDERIVRALFGDPTRCRFCLRVYLEAPEVCECGAVFEGCAPLTFAELLVLLGEIRGEEASGGVSLTADLEVEEGVVVLLPTLRVDEEVYHLPSYEVPLSDYEAGMSLPAHLEEELVRLLRRKFR